MILGAAVGALFTLAVVLGIVSNPFDHEASGRASAAAIVPITANAGLAPPQPAYSVPALENSTVTGTADSGGEMYWGEYGVFKIRRANLDGSGAQDIVTGLPFCGPSSVALDVDAGKIYWICEGQQNIQRANLDGSGVETLANAGQSPRAIALDLAAGKMYWTFSDGLGRANLDGSDVENLVTQRPKGISLDVAAGKMYWTFFPFFEILGGIRRANLDGSDVEDLVAGGRAASIALDVDGGKMYWGDDFAGMIRRANLDGSAVEDVLPSTDTWELELDVSCGKAYWTEWSGWRIRSANLDGSNVEDLLTGITTAPGGIALATSTPSLDTDGDGVPDCTDNCPNWHNPAQELPSWPVPADDPDCDGFDTTTEIFIGTDPFGPCAADSTANNEGPPDKWPMDFTDNQFVNAFDLIPFIGKLNTVAPGPPYDVRLDLFDANGRINAFDLIPFIGNLNKACLP